MERLARIREAARVLYKQPGFTATAVLTLALGIGANTAIFSIVNAVFLRPLPYPHAGQIYRLRRVNNRIGGSAISPAIYIRWRERTDLFDGIGVIGGSGDVTLRTGGEPASVRMAAVTPGILSVFAVQPQMGRLFDPEEEQPGTAKVAIISDSLWRSRFGASVGILGQVITLNTSSYSIVGVMPSSFEIPFNSVREAQVWVPYQLPATASQNPSNGISCIARLRSGATPKQAEAALTEPLIELSQQFPNMIFPVERANLVRLSDSLRAGAGTAPLLLLGAVALVLLIACANVANLLLARATGRQREIAIRASLGASRRDIVNQLLTESILLGLFGGLAGLMLCSASFSIVLSLVPAGLPHVGAIHIDAWVLAFGLVLGVLTGLIFGLAPSLVLSKTDLQIVMKEGNFRSRTSRERGSFRSALIVGEIALGVVLLVGAALLLQSFARLMRVDLGFNPNNVETFRISLPPTYDTTAKQIAFYDDFAAQLARRPAVLQAGYLSGGLPTFSNDILFSVEGQNAGDENAKGDARFRPVSDGYLQVMRIPLLRGRLITVQDSAKSEPVIVVNRSLAEHFWPNGDAIGSFVWIGKPMGPGAAEPSPRRIVGIVGDIRGESLAGGPSYDMYAPAAQFVGGLSSVDFVVRSAQPPAGLEPAIRTMLGNALPLQPPGTIQTMSELIANSSSVKDMRFHTMLLGLFGGLGLLIVTVGVFGVVSYFVSQRTHEFGVRVALGAARWRVLAMVLRQGLVMTVAGVAAGLAASFVLTQLLRSMLFEVQPNDPLALAGASILMTGVSLAACWIPARKATKVDPLVALRYE